MIITSERNIKTTPAILFEAFANPEHLVQWWGPKGLSNKVQAFDFKPQGLWTFITNTPDGKLIGNASQFIDIVKDQRISFLHIDPAPRYTMTMNFKAVTETTANISWHMQFEPNVENDKFRPMVELATARNLDRLEVYLPKVKI
jgi:uncharacterized protein YndB with AHSA1/START domain